MMVINTTRILGYTAMAFAAAALGTQELAAYQASSPLHLTLNGPFQRLLTRRSPDFHLVLHGFSSFFARSCTGFHHFFIGYHRVFTGFHRSSSFFLSYDQVILGIFVLFAFVGAPISQTAQSLLPPLIESGDTKQAREVGKNVLTLGVGAPRATGTTL